MIVVNLYAGPDSGKTTLAHQIMAIIKTTRTNLICEHVSEYAKRLVLEDRRAAMSNQIKILGHQFQELGNLWNKADIVICDGPILHGVIYGGLLDYPAPFYELALWADRQFQTINVFVERQPDKPFEQVGRLQNLEQSRAIDADIKAMLNRLGAKLDYSGPSDSEFKTARTIAEMAIDAAMKAKTASKPASWFDLEGPKEYRKVA